MKVEQLTMAQERAQELYQECREALKTHAAARKSEFIKDLRRLYGQLSRKRRILELPASFSKAAVFEDGSPRLALAPGNQEKAYFRKLQRGAGVFRRVTSFNRWKTPNLKEDVRLPEGTFPEWPHSPGVTWFSPWEAHWEPDLRPMKGQFLMAPDPHQPDPGVRRSWDPLNLQPFFSQILVDP